jgi:hypothetical protein
MGIGDFVTNLFGSKNKTKATAPAVDSNAYQYGGNPGGAHEAASRYASLGQDAQNRTAAQATYDPQDRAMALAARQKQEHVGNMMLSRAMGHTPSIAGMQAQQDMQRAQAAQTAQASSARGAAGIAMAQQNAANNTANAMGQISGQAQVNAANERLQAEQNALGAFGQVRGGDQNQQQIGTQQQQFNAGLQQQQRGFNDNYQLGMTNAEMGVRNSQLGAGMNQQAQTSANALGATGINAGVAGQNANMNQGNAMNLIGLGQGAAGAAMGMGKAEGGPIATGRPYVVGERGPELIVPSQDGVVIPNHALGRSPGINPTGQDGRPSVADTVISTWGTGPGATRAQAAMAADQRGAPIAEDERRARERDERLAGGAGPQAIASPLADMRQQDQERVSTVRAYQDHGLDVSGRDEYEADNAERRLAKGKATDRGKARATLASRLSSGGKEMQQQAAMIDTAYHGPGGGYVPPQLIPIGARAGGGPIAGGSPYLVGEAGPEVVNPFVGGGSALKQIGGPGAAAAAPVSFAGASGLGGGSVAGEYAAHNRFATGFQRNAGANPMAYGDADGGPVGAGERHVVGERGPEVVVPIGNPMPGVNLHMGNDGRAFYEHDVDVDDGRPRLESRGGGGEAAKAKAPELAKAPTAAAPPKTRKLTDEELLAEADRQMSGMQTAHDARMAQGPAVRMPVAINKVAKRYALADMVPPSRKRQGPEAPATAYPVAPPIEGTLPPPRPPPIEAQEDSSQFESPNEQAVYDYARTLQGTGMGRQSYDPAAMLRSEPDGPSFAQKLREAKKGWRR